MSSDKQKIAALKQKQEKKIVDALAPEPMQEDKKSAQESSTAAQAPHADSGNQQKADDKDKETAGKSNGSGNSAAAAKAKREKRSIGEFYGWSAGNDVLKQFFDTRFAQEDFDALKARVEKAAAKCEVTLDDVLEMKANVMNQREADKLSQIAQKQQELRDAAESALETLLARAQVDKKQREARELKRKLAADRKQTANNK